MKAVAVVFSTLELIVVLPLARGEAARCAPCHARIWDTYRTSGMAQSFYRPTPQTLADAAYYHQPSDTWYAMKSRNGRWFQRQYQAGSDGLETNVRETAVDYVLGSGNQARSYLHLNADRTLVLLPLGWYREEGGHWGMNPGYDRADHPALRRNISYDCMFCHNGYPEIPEGSATPRASPKFTSIPEGIDCERCHGTGDRHIALAQRGAGLADVRAAITNPSRLTTERQLEVCMQCHLETTSSPLPDAIVRYDRGPFSYRPGEPLGDFKLIFDHAAGTGYDDKFEITGSVYRLRKSRCFRESGGALTCTTCHDPHNGPRDYSKACRQCHAAAFERLVAAGSHTASANCIGCHMPKRRADDVVHAVMTDHLIQRRFGGNLLAQKPERRQTEATAYRGEVVLYYPPSLPKAEDELYLAVAQVNQDSNRGAGIARLTAAIARFRPASAEFYLQLGDALCNDGKCDVALPMYEEGLRHEPGSQPALMRLANCLVTLRQYPRALSNLAKASRLAPDDPLPWMQSGLALLGQGKTADAITAFEKAGKADPDLPEPWNLMGAIRLETGDKAGAERALREAIRLQPNFAAPRNNLGNLLSESGRFDEASHQFEAALRYKDDYVEARFNYALALNRAHRLSDARAQVEGVLRSRPDSAEAHEFLGNLLNAEGLAERAIAEYREALRIQPAFDRANLDLGRALAAAGSSAAAVPHLQKAAGSGDPEIRQAAEQTLRKISR